MADRVMVIPELAGLSVRLVDGTIVRFVADEGGVREPRRPKPKKDNDGARRYSKV